MERFWEKVDKSPGFGPNGDCWRWTAGKNNYGYGKFWIGGRAEGAHRVVLRFSGEEAAPGALVLHSCDMPDCVNPAHLRIGTPADNVRDRVERGRRPTKPHRDNTSGMLGVSGLRAYFTTPTGRRLSKRCKSKEEAEAQYKAWRKEYLGQPD